MQLFIFKENPCFQKYERHHQGLQGSTNTTKQLIQSLWWQHFGFLAVIAFHSMGANSYNRRHCLYEIAFCLLWQILLSFPHLSKVKASKNVHSVCSTGWIWISQDTCMWKSPTDPCKGLFQYQLSWVAIAIRMGLNWRDKLEMILCKPL